VAVIPAALRTRHWVKNVFVLAPLVFAKRAADPAALGRSLAAFAVFCALSSAVYLVNDLADREADRHHPRKRNRPVASGRLGVPAASVLALVLAAAGLAGSFFLGTAFTGVCCAYLFLNLAYSSGLKQFVILDVMIVASGFLLRAWAGAVVLGVAMSNWLVLCTGSLAVFISLVKRRQEIADLEEEATRQRASLRGYSLPLLDQMISVATAATLLGYALYAFSPEVARKLGTPHMGWTFPFVLFGLFRYLYLVHQKGEGDNPTEVFLSDVPLILTMVCWGALVLLILFVV
jgi:4-hydroxybenzoate polyprenyltransferase